MRFLSDERLYSRTENCLQFLRELDDPPEDPAPGPPTRVHLYWRGGLTLKTAFAVKSFLATQDLERTELWLWLDRRSGYHGCRRNPLLRPLLPFLELRQFDPRREVRDTPLERSPALFRTRLPPAQSDAFRLMVLHQYGGIYADADTMFLRDIRSLLLQRDLADEFCERWSERPFGNSAVLRLRQGGETAHALMMRSVRLGSCHPREVLRFAETDDIDLLVLPSGFFDPLWLHNDGKDTYAAAPFDHFKDFFRRFDADFQRRQRINSYREFFPGAFTYQWHNFWRAPEHEDSYFGVFNRQFDVLLRDRLGVEVAASGRPARLRRPLAPRLRSGAGGLGR
jgi:Glycosyltransferase sugar-binding region containing DXD motif